MITFSLRPFSFFFSHLPPSLPLSVSLSLSLSLSLYRQIEDGWWMGMRNGKIGAFPSNFVKEIFVAPKGMELNILNVSMINGKSKSSKTKWCLMFRTEICSEFWSLCLQTSFIIRSSLHHVSVRKSKTKINLSSSVCE